MSKFNQTAPFVTVNLMNTQTSKQLDHIRPNSPRNTSVQGTCLRTQFIFKGSPRAKVGFRDSLRIDNPMDTYLTKRFIFSSAKIQFAGPLHSRAPSRNEETSNKRSRILNEKSGTENESACPEIS